MKTTYANVIIQTGLHYSQPFVASSDVKAKRERGVDGIHGWPPASYFVFGNCGECDLLVNPLPTEAIDFVG